MKKYIAIAISSIMVAGCVVNTPKPSQDSEQTDGVSLLEANDHAIVQMDLTNISTSQSNQGSEYYKLGAKYEDGKDVEQDLVKAKEYYEKAIELGSIDAANALGALYANTGDYANAKKYFLIASKQGDEIANFNLGGVSFIDFKTGQVNSEAIKYYKLSGEKGYAPAYVALGDMYATGEGAKPDEKLAEDYYFKAVELNDSVAIDRLALLYLLQDGMDAGTDTQNSDKTIQLFQKVAEKGNPKAMYVLSMAYQNGLYVPKDELKGLEYLKKSAKAGYVEAEYALSYLYLTGMYVPKDYEKGVYYMTKAAEQGLPTAQNNIGMLLIKGEVVKQDYKTGMYWLNKAASSDNPMANYNLGLVYELGMGVSKNPSKAGEYFILAANGQYIEAISKVVDMYSIGSLGVKQDNEKARMWLDKGVELGSGDIMLQKANGYYWGKYGYAKDHERAKEWLDKAKEYAPEKADKLESSWKGSERYTRSAGRSNAK